MNGAESVVRTLLACGIDTCFANPGTSEMHFVAALDRVAGMRCVLGLFEGVVTGAADGYARMTEKPAATLLHCGPGLANGLANLHNARRADVPMVNIVGDQATHHRPLDPPLTADTEGWARPISAWLRRSTNAASVATDAALAVQAARSASGIATLILPSDVSWSQGGVTAPALAVPSRPVVTDEAIADGVATLRSGEATALVLGGTALEAGALADAHRIAKATGAKLIAPTFTCRIERGRGRHPIDRIPYPVDEAIAAMAGTRHVLLVGAREPVIFFAYPGKPGRPHPDDAIPHVLARPDEDAGDALARLANALAAPPVPPPAMPPSHPVGGAVTSAAFGETLSALLPDNAIVVDESITFGQPLYAATANAAPHDWLRLVGGAIGEGLPLATGAAVGAPGRRVVTLQADGSALYTVQALWTQARERLDVTTVILANRRYDILFAELANSGARPGPVAGRLFDLGSPAMDWIRISEGFGVEAARAETIEQFADLFTHANDRPGPFVIELVIP